MRPWTCHGAHAACQPSSSGPGRHSPQPEYEQFSQLVSLSTAPSPWSVVSSLGPGAHRRRGDGLPLTQLTLKCQRQPLPGHIGGKSPLDLPGTDENHRDLSHRSDHMTDASAMVRNMAALDPAYRPTCWPLQTIMPGSANQAASSAAAAKRQQPHGPQVTAITQHERSDLPG